MDMTTLVAETYRRDRPLAIAGGVLLGLTLLMIPAACYDALTEIGLERWARPITFTGALALFSWTMVWLIGYLPLSFERKRNLGRSIAAILYVVAAAFVCQAAGGQAHHFNTLTPLDTALLNTMHVTLLGLTGIMFLVLLVFCYEDVPLPALHLWGIRAGLAMFVLGTLALYVLVQVEANVGAATGVDGLAAWDTNLSTAALLVAFLLGLYALMVLPLLGAKISRRESARPWSTKLAFGAGCTAYGALIAAVFSSALYALPVPA